MSNKNYNGKKITTPEGTFSFPWLTTPDTKFNPEGEYRVSLVLPADEAEPLVAEIRATMEQAMADAKANFEGQLAKATTGRDKAKLQRALDNLKMAPEPFKESYDDDGNPDGSLIFRFKLKAQYKRKGSDVVTRRSPKIFDAAGREMINPPAIWGGTRGCIGGFIKPYSIATDGSVGASLNLSAVQIIDLVTEGGGNAASFGFSSKEGGYRHEDSSYQGGSAMGVDAPDADDDGDINF